MSLFDSGKYYMLTSDVYGSDFRTAVRAESGGPLDVYMSRSNRTSQNWQFFYQDGVYFIRNYDYNATWHLGVISSNSTEPMMLAASTELGQQWFIELWTDGSKTFKFTNRLLGRGIDNSTYLAVSGSDRPFALEMSSVVTGSQWGIRQNTTVGDVPPSMLQPYTYIAQTGSQTSTTPRLSPPLHTGYNSSAPPLGQSESSSGHRINGLDIAGIIIGLIVFIALLIGGVLVYRRYKKYGNLRRPKAPGPQPTPRHGRAEVIPSPPPAYSANQGASFMGHTPAGRPKAADEESIELPHYGRPSVEAKSFV